jgi:outer membrane immunogenic protein
MKKIVFATVVAALGSASAFAADMPSRGAYTKAVDPSYNWSGFYGGLNAGAVRATDNNSLAIVNNGFFSVGVVSDVAAAGSGSASSTGFIGGGQLGYNWQASNFVYGLEADLERLSGRRNLGGTFVFRTSGNPYTLTGASSADWLFTLRPRLGFTTSQTLWYATGGLAVANRAFTLTYSEPGFGPFSSSASKAQAGWTVGAGVETLIGGKWTAKAEYLYARFESLNPTLVLQNGPAFTGSLNNADVLNLHILRAGVNYHF